MKNYFYILLCCLIFNSCNKEGKKNSIVVENEIPKLSLKKYDTISRNKLLKLANKYAYKKNFYEINKIIVNKSESIKDTIGIIKANSNIGLYFFNKFSNDSAYYYFSKAEKLSQKQNGHPYMSEILQSKADLKWCQKDYAGAESTAINALKIANNNNRIIYSCNITLANSLAGMNRDEKALEYYNKAVLKLEELKTLPQYFILKAQTQNYIAQIYQKQNRHQKVLNYLESNIQYDLLKKEDVNMYLYVMNTLAYSKFKLGDKSSVNQFVEILNVAKKINNISVQLTSKTYLGEYYLEQKDTLKANYYLKDGWHQAHNNKIYEEELKLLQLLIQANPNNSSFYSKKYISLNDRMQNIERSGRDKFARIEFETDEITDEKNVFENKNLQLLNSITVVIGIGVLAILLIYLIYKNLLQKAKTKQLLLEQEHQKDTEEIYQLMLAQQQQIEEGKSIEKQRISQELHDGVMGKLSAVRLNLYAALYKANLIEDTLFLQQLDEIEHVEKEIRAIAHDLNSNLFAENANFIRIVKELFNNIENHSQIHFTLQISEAFNWDLITNVIKINLYRVLQEALQNIEKYAGATNVVVAMALTECNEINMTITDDGNGFDTKQKKNGIGIKNMEARVIELNGSFTIQSEVGKETKINLIIPF